MSKHLKQKLPARLPRIDEVVRPWGKFRQYAHNHKVTVSLMFVRAGHRLSLQSHANRAELYIVLDPGAVVQIGKRILRPRAGAELWIPSNTKHRLGSRRGTVRVLEVAFGDWQHADIVRYDDDYARTTRKT